jgi:hypothetical protein
VRYTGWLEPEQEYPAQADVQIPVGLSGT